MGDAGGDRRAPAHPLQPQGANLLERHDELHTLGAMVARLRRGDGGAALVRGPAGIGKTRLLAWAAEEARSSELTVMRTRCAELESEFAFGAVRNLFEPVLRQLAPDRREVVMSGAARAAAPALDPSAPAATEAQILGADPATAIIHGLYWLTANLADERPVLIVVDDLQWADPLSSRFVSYLSNRTEDVALLVLGAVRTGETAATEHPLLAHSGVSEVISPEPLSALAVASLIKESLQAEPAPAFVAACMSATSGNPFLLVELLAELSERGVTPTAGAAAAVHGARPQAIVGSVVQRLARLTGDSRGLAHAIAILGDGASLRHASELAEIESRAAAGAAVSLAAAGLIADGLPLQFVHPLVRSAVYEAIPAATRALDHARAAHLLGRDRAGAGQIAAQLMLSEPRCDSGAVRILREAARGAIARGAPAAAVAYLRRARSEPPGDEAELAELLAELGRAETLAYDPAGVETLRAARDAVTDPHRRGELAIELGRALMMSGRLGDGADMFEAAIAELDDDADELSLRLEADLINAARLDMSRRAAATDRLTLTAEKVSGKLAAERLVLANVALETTIRGEPAPLACERAMLALGNGALLAEESSDLPVYYLAVWALIVCGRFTQAEEAIDAALADARRRGSPLGFSIASCFASNLYFRMGRIPDAAASARSVIDLPAEQRWALGLPMGISYLLDALIERGELDEGLEVLAGTGLGEEIPELPMLMPLLFSRGKLRLVRGEVQAGLSDLLQCGERAWKWGSRNPSFLAWRSYAAPVLMALGETEHAHSLVEEDLQLCRAAESPVGIGIALRTAGMLRTGEESERTLAGAADQLERAGARLEQARALLELGASRRRQRRRSDARDPLRRARELARECGATVLERRAHEELLATGSRPRRLALSGLQSLTPSELRVARLAAAGRSNTNIAQELFITRKTVEKHLGSVYSKLDLSSRGELPAALHG